jgi:hypothetical protein
MVLGISDRTLAYTAGTIGETSIEKESAMRPERMLAAFDKVLELGIPFAELGCESDDRIEFFVTLTAPGMIGERWPMYGTFLAELPGKDFEERMWEV